MSYVYDLTGDFPLGLNTKILYSDITNNSIIIANLKIILINGNDVIIEFTIPLTLAEQTELNIIVLNHNPVQKYTTILLGNIDGNCNYIYNIKSPIGPTYVTNKQYVDDQLELKANILGQIFTGDLFAPNINAFGNISGNLNNGDNINVHSNLDLNCDKNIFNVDNLSICNNLTVEGNISGNLFNNNANICVFNTLDLKNNKIINADLQLEGNIDGNLEFNCEYSLNNVKTINVCDDILVGGNGIILGNISGNLKNDSLIYVYSNLDLDCNYINNLEIPVQKKDAVNKCYVDEEINSHIHVIANILDLQSNLDIKANLTGDCFTGLVKGTDINLLGNLYANLNNGSVINVYSNLDFNCEKDINNVRDLTVCGNLVVLGNSTIIQSTIVEVGDNAIKLGSNNLTSLVDPSVYMCYSNDGSNVLYKGWFMDASDNCNVNFFKGLDEEPDVIVNKLGSGYTKADLVVGNIDTCRIISSDDIVTKGNLSGNLNNVSDIYIFSNLEFNCEKAINNVKNITVCNDGKFGGNVIGNINNGDNIFIYSNVSVDNNFINNLNGPIHKHDAVNKEYIDNKLEDLIQCGSIDYTGIVVCESNELQMITPNLGTLAFTIDCSELFEFTFNIISNFWAQVTPQPDTPYYYYGDNCLIWKAMIFGDQAELVESFPGSYFIDEKTCSFYHHSSNLSGNICGFEGNCWEKCCSLNTGDVQGNLVGDVQGNLVGDVIGDICGNVKGDVIGNFFGNVIGGSYGNINVYSNLEFNCLNEINNIKNLSVCGNISGNLCKYDNSSIIVCSNLDLSNNNINNLSDPVNDYDAVNKKFVENLFDNFGTFRWSENSDENGINSGEWTNGLPYGGIGFAMYNGSMHPWITWTGSTEVHKFKLWIEDTLPALPSSTAAIEQISNPCTSLSTKIDLTTITLPQGACGVYTYNITPSASGDEIILRFRETSGIYSNRWRISYLNYSI